MVRLTAKRVAKLLAQRKGEFIRERTKNYYRYNRLSSRLTNEAFFPDKLPKGVHRYRLEFRFPLSPMLSDTHRVAVKGKTIQSAIKKFHRRIPNAKILRIKKEA